MKEVTSALVLGAAMLVCACSSGGDAGEGGGDAGAEPDTSGATPDFQVEPTTLYSGYDGDSAHTFHIPFAAYGAGADLKATVADTSVVTLQPTALENPDGDAGKWFMLTVKKAGKTKVAVSSGGKTIQVDVNVTAYDRSLYGAGETRYKNGDGSEQPPCAECHSKTGGPDHSPYKLAPIPDNQVKAIITTGILNNFPIREVDHRWTPNDDQLKGLVTYLRALPPRGFAQR